MDWISKLDSSKKLNEIFFPGTHDSGAYTLDYSINIFKGPQKFINFLVPISKYFINKWTLTQNKDILEQLNMGVRAFDIRVSKFGEIYYVSHTFIAITMQSLADQINIFLENNPNEFIIIHFKTDYNHRNSIPTIFDPFNKFRTLLKNDVFLNKSHDTVISEIKGHILVYTDEGSNGSFNNVWLNKDNVKDFFESYNNTLPKSNCINCIDVVLTPTTNTIIKNPFGSLLKFAKSIKYIIGVVANSTYANDLKWNVIYCDFIDEDIIKTIINKNFK